MSRPVQGLRVAGLVEHAAHVLDAGAHRVELDEPPLGRRGDSTCASVVLPVPGGPQRITETGPAGPPAASARRRSGEPAREQVLLADDLVDASAGASGRRAAPRAPPRDGARAGGGVVLAHLEGAGEQVAHPCKAIRVLPALGRLIARHPLRFVAAWAGARRAGPGRRPPAPSGRGCSTACSPATPRR